MAALLLPRVWLTLLIGCMFGWAAIAFKVPADKVIPFGMFFAIPWIIGNAAALHFEPAPVKNKEVNQ